MGNDLRELRDRILTWANKKAWLSNQSICSNTLNLLRFHERLEPDVVNDSISPQEAFERVGLFSLIHEQDSAFSDVLASQLKDDDLLGIAYYLSKYKGALRDYALNRLCLRYPVLNERRDEIRGIIENPKEHWPASPSSRNRFLYNDVALAFGDLQELPCSLGGTWSSLMLRIPDFQASFRSDKRIGNLLPLVLELSESPQVFSGYIEYTFCGEGENLAAEILLEAGELIYATQFKMQKIREYVLGEKNKSRFLDQLLAFPDSWLFPVADSSLLADELLGERLSHLFVSTYLAQPVHHRAAFLKGYGESGLVETAGELDDVCRAAKLAGLPSASC